MVQTPSDEVVINFGNQTVTGHLQFVPSNITASDLETSSSVSML